ncbi:hypothetical protein [Microbulbifer sp. ANSA005]|uniref:hypothetical protein n=1 Tax=Microbulbifer sp. ANSA005 TaxID=3243362 RepID=UPI0040412174
MPIIEALTVFSMDLYTINLTTKTRKMVNPFTEEVSYASVDNPITASAKSNLKQLLLELGATSEEDTYVYVPLESGTTLRLGIFNFLENESLVGIAFEYDDLDISLAKALFQICRTGELIIRSGTDEEPVAVVAELANPSLQSRWLKLEKIRRAEDLLTWMQSNLECNS